MRVDQWGEPGCVGVEDGVVLCSQGVEGGVGVAGVPQHDGVEDQTQRS